MSTLLFLLAAIIFAITAIGEWPTTWDLEPIAFGLFFVALGLAWGPLWAFVEARR